MACKKSSVEATKWLVAGPDKELVEGLKQKAKRDSINRSPEEREARQKQQDRLADIEAIRKAEIERLRAEGGENADIYNDELKTTDKREMSYNMGLVFVAIILLGFGFLVWWTIIRKIRNNIRDLSYTKAHVQDKMAQAMNDPRFKNMSDEERQSVAKMRNYLSDD